MKYLVRSMGGCVLLAGCVALTAACTTVDDKRGASISSGGHYVAMGSSYAAGPGITTSADQPPSRCARSVDNYAHLLARKLDLQLSDVSCSGATTAQLLSSWGSVPPQIDALTVDTRLVTITIGGNDVAYIGTLGSASCRTLAARSSDMPSRKCPAPELPVDAWTKLEAALHRIVSEVRQRSPSARLIFVDYLSVLPEHGICAGTPLSPGGADASRATALRLAALTARIAAQTQSEVFKASALSRGHSACAKDPWVTGFTRPDQADFVPYHPNARGMAAIANGLAQHLSMSNGA